MTIGERIKLLRTQSNLTQDELAQYANTTKQTIHKYETGIITNIPANKIKAISEKLCTTPAYLMGWEDQNETYPNNLNLPEPTITENYTTFPVIGEVAAGYDSIAIEDWEGDCVDIPNSYLRGRNKNEFFTLRIKGNSMYPLYHEGDVVLILKQPTLNRSGDIGVVLYDD